MGVAQVLRLRNNVWVSDQRPLVEPASTRGLRRRLLVLFARIHRDATRFSPAEQWLRRNGFPALVPGFGRWRMVARNPLWTAISAVAWGALFLVVGASLVLGNGLLESDSPISVADSQRVAEQILDASWVGRHPALTVLACLLLGIGFSILSVGRVALFSVGWFIHVARTSTTRFFTVLPLLMVAVMFFFLAAETWQSVGSLDPVAFMLSCLLLLLLSVGFLMARSRKDLDQIRAFDDLDDLRAALPQQTVPPALAKALGLVPATEWTVPDSSLPDRELGRLERSNITAIGVLGKFIASVLVAVVVGIFFLIFGVVAVNADTARAWLGREPHSLLSFTPISHTYFVSSETVQVSIFLAVFSGMYFVVSASSDQEFSRSLNDDTELHLRTAFAVRAIAQADDRLRRLRRRRPAAE